MTEKERRRGEEDARVSEPGRLFAVPAFSRVARQTCWACQGSRPLCSPGAKQMWRRCGGKMYQGKWEGL